MKVFIAMSAESVVLCFENVRLSQFELLQDRNFFIIIFIDNLVNKECS